MNDLSRSNVVWTHHRIQADSGFRFFRESMAEHRDKHSGRPHPAGAGVEVVAYEPTEDGPQRYWYLVTTIPGDGIGEPVERPGYPCIYVDPLTLLTPLVLPVGTQNAKAIMAERFKRATMPPSLPVKSIAATKPANILRRWWEGILK